MKLISLVILALIILCGCDSKNTVENNVNIPDTPSAKIEDIRLPEATNNEVYDNGITLVDYSNIEEGYIMVKTLNTEHKRLKLQIINNDQVYSYDINKELAYEAFPLNMGSGLYTVKVFENIQDSRYALISSYNINVDLKDELLPYLYPSQIVDYDSHNEVIIKSFEITADLKNDLYRVQAIYKYVTETIDSDWDKADVANSKYILPVIDETLSNQKGICFDYAAVMAAMLRVQNIPTKVVTGNVDEGYHAWVEVYIESFGWITPHIYFEQDEWNLMDPTFEAMDSEYDGKYHQTYQY